MNAAQRKREPAREIDRISGGLIPRHVAIIMDGNGRWATKRHFGRIRGHRAGIRSIRTISRAASRAGIGYLTLYAFSTENWSRPEKEVRELWNLLVEYLEKEVPSLVEHNIRLSAIGRIRKIPEHARKKLAWARKQTARCDGLVLTLALNYGSRDEIVDAVNALLARDRSGVNADAIERHLYTRDMPDPDLLIRTSGEKRLSNFLLWQLSYAELVFTEVLWPDFTEEEFFRAIEEFQSRNRRFGGI
jgi:undecaprenyl diphosphate synthase